MKTVDELIDEVLHREGGYVDHPADRGGPTNHGITLKVLSQYIGYAATENDMKTLDVQVAKDIYEKNYYYGPGIQKLPQQIQGFIFDCAVNHGARRAIKFVQKVCNDAGYKPTLDVDGAMGPNTLKGAQSVQDKMKDQFLLALFEERKNFYRTIVEHDSSQRVFLNGWMNRVMEFEKDFAKSKDN
jgi:lysozyme family protein